MDISIHLSSPGLLCFLQPLLDTGSKKPPVDGWFCFRYHWTNQEYLATDGYQASGGVRGGTIRLLPVDSKAEATRSRLLSS